MNTQIDRHIQTLAHKKKYSELSNSELKFVQTYSSKVEYDNYHTLFSQVNIHFNNLDSKIPVSVRGAIFSSFNKNKTSNKVISFSHSKNWSKSLIAVAASVIVFISIYTFYSEKEEQSNLAKIKLNHSNQSETFGLEANFIDEVSLNLMAMDTPSKNILPDGPSCDW